MSQWQPRRICVFCGSAKGKRPEYAETAVAMGALLAARGIGLVYGGGNIGLMGLAADACLQATPIANSQLGEHLAKPDWHHHHDHFLDSNPNVEWEATLDQAEKIGLGTRAYELKRV